MLQTHNWCSTKSLKKDTIGSVKCFVVIISVVDRPFVETIYDTLVKPCILLSCSHTHTSAVHIVHMGSSTF